VTNPNYAAWISRDQRVLGWIVNSLSPEILAHVLDYETTAEVWSTITGIFSSTSKSKVSHMRTALNKTKKKDLSAAQYFTIMKGFVFELVVAGKIIDDHELIGYILNGLDKSYNALVDRVQANPGTTLDDPFGQLQAFDMHQIMLEEEDSVSFVYSANLVQQPRDNRPRQGQSPDGRHDVGNRGYRGCSADRGGGYHGWSPDRRHDDRYHDGRCHDGRHRDDMHGQIMFVMMTGA
jgi:hypothetical protein